MSIQVTGIIEGPLGTPSPGITIRVVSKISYKDTYRLSTEDHVTTTGGAYDFQLNEGFHKILIRYRGASSFTKLGDVSVSDQTPSPITLINLLESSSPNALVVKLQELADDASESAQSASDDADQVALDKQQVTLLAQQVSDDADQVALDKSATAQSEANTAQSAADAAASATSAAQSEANVNQAVTGAQEELLPPGSEIYPEVGILQNGDVVTAGTTHLRVLVDGKPTIVETFPQSTGIVSNLTSTSATIGSVDIELLTLGSADLRRKGDVRGYGVTGIGDDSVAFSKALNGAELMGTPVIIPEFMDIFITSEQHLRGLTLTGGGTITSGVKHLFTTSDGTENTKFIDVKFRTAIKDAFVVRANDNLLTGITVRGCEFDGFLCGISAPVFNADISHNLFKDTVQSDETASSIYLQSDAIGESEETVIVGNRFTNVNGGILAAGRAVINGNIFNSIAKTHCIYASGSEGTVICGNRMNGVREGIATSKTKNLVALGNRIKVYGRNALRLYECDGLIFKGNDVTMDCSLGTASSFVFADSRGGRDGSEFVNIEGNNFEVINGVLDSNPLIFLSDGDSKSGFYVDFKSNKFRNIDTSHLTGSFYEQAFAKIHNPYAGGNRVRMLDNDILNITPINKDNRGRQILLRGVSEERTLIKFNDGESFDTSVQKGSVWMDVGSSGQIASSFTDGVCKSVSKGQVGKYEIEFNSLVALNDVSVSSTLANYPRDVNVELSNTASNNPYYTSLTITLLDDNGAPYDPNFDCRVLVGIDAGVNMFSDIQYKYNLQ